MTLPVLSRSDQMSLLPSNTPGTFFLSSCVCCLSRSGIRAVAVRLLMVSSASVCGVAGADNTIRTVSLLPVVTSISPPTFAPVNGVLVALSSSNSFPASPTYLLSAAGGGCTAVVGSTVSAMVTSTSAMTLTVNAAPISQGGVYDLCATWYSWSTVAVRAASVNVGERDWLLYCHSLQS